MAHELSIGALHPLQKADDAIQDFKKSIIVCSAYVIVNFFGCDGAS